MLHVRFYIHSSLFLFHYRKEARLEVGDWKFRDFCGGFVRLWRRNSDVVSLLKKEDSVRRRILSFRIFGAFCFKNRSVLLISVAELGIQDLKGRFSEHGSLHLDSAISRILASRLTWNFEYRFWTI